MARWPKRLHERAQWQRQRPGKTVDGPPQRAAVQDQKI